MVVGMITVLLGSVLSAGPSVRQAPITVFKGLPSLKISEGGVERTPVQLPAGQAINVQCVISQIGTSFYWASRENVPLVRVDSGAFTTFIASNGSGYVRIVNPEAKAAASLMSPTEERFDYMEHVVIGLRTVTYYGSRTASHGNSPAEVPNQTAVVQPITGKWTSIDGKLVGFFTGPQTVTLDEVGNSIRLTAVVNKGSGSGAVVSGTLSQERESLSGRVSMSYSMNPGGTGPAYCHTTVLLSLTLSTDRRFLTGTATIQSAVPSEPAAGVFCNTITSSRQRTVTLERSQ